MEDFHPAIKTGLKYIEALQNRNSRPKMFTHSFSVNFLMMGVESLLGGLIEEKGFFIKGHSGIGGKLDFAIENLDMPTDLQKTLKVLDFSGCNTEKVEDVIDIITLNICIDSSLKLKDWALAKLAEAE